MNAEAPSGVCPLLKLNLSPFIHLNNATARVLLECSAHAQTAAGGAGRQRDPLRAAHGYYAVGGWHKRM